MRRHAFRRVSGEGVARNAPRLEDMSQPQQHSSIDLIAGGGHDMAPPARVQTAKRMSAAVIVVALVLAVGATRTMVSNVMNARHPADAAKQSGRQYAGAVRPATAGEDERIALSCFLPRYMAASIDACATGRDPAAFAGIPGAAQQWLASERDEVQIHRQQPVTALYLARGPGSGWSADARALACGAGPCCEVPAGTARRGG